MINKLILTLDISSDWHIGSGEEGGAYADALVLKDSNNLPYLPGRALKGLLRDAFEQGVSNHWFEHGDDQKLVNDLFGGEGEGIETQGIIQVSSGCLSEEEKAYLISEPSASSKLYRVIRHTAIDNETGVAQETSLRSIEVTIPMTLKAEITFNAEHPKFSEYENSKTLLKWLAQSSRLIMSFGAKRQRGFGEIAITSHIQ